MDVSEWKWSLLKEDAVKGELHVWLCKPPRAQSPRIPCGEEISLLDFWENICCSCIQLKFCLSWFERSTKEPLTALVTGHRKKPRKGNRGGQVVSQQHWRATSGDQCGDPSQLMPLWPQAVPSERHPGKQRPGATHTCGPVIVLGSPLSQRGEGETPSSSDQWLRPFYHLEKRWTCGYAYQRTHKYPPPFPNTYALL